MYTSRYTLKIPRKINQQKTVAYTDLRHNRLLMTSNE